MMRQISVQALRVVSAGRLLRARTRLGGSRTANRVDDDHKNDTNVCNTQLRRHICRRVPDFIDCRRCSAFVSCHGRIRLVPFLGSRLLKPAVDGLPPPDMDLGTAGRNAKPQLHGNENRTAVVSNHMSQRALFPTDTNNPLPSIQ